MLFLLVGLGGWAWLTRPETLRLVQTLPLASGEMLKNGHGGPAFFGQPGGLYLRLDVAPTQARVKPETITLIGWDGQPRWRVVTAVDFGLPSKLIDNISYRLDFTFPEVVYSARQDEYGSRAVALSPDGHVFAQAQIFGNCWQVESWRDGRLLGRARVSPRARYQPYPMIQATNSGRIWVYDRKSSPCKLWAIDGARVSGGHYIPTFSTTCEYEHAVSPGGAYLLCDCGVSLEYVTLQVRNGRVLATRRYILNHLNQQHQWLDDTRALGYAGSLIGPDGLIHDRQGWHGDDYHGAGQITRAVQYMIEKDDTRMRIYRLPPEQPWVVPLNPHREITDRYCLADRSAVLFQERSFKLPRMLWSLQRLNAVNNLLNRWPRLALYTAPGKLRAVLPGVYQTFALSPDGHRVAVLARNGKHQEIRIYAWGKDATKVRR
ncbi:MAG TPA: hypothetical protein VGM23_13630 [Armatimonadota bacterium]|jgi:hypothetical protein